MKQTPTKSAPNGGSAANAEASEAIHKQIRGSGLLLSGRVISVGITTLTQVLIVRHLSTYDFGAWSYALAVMFFWQSVSNLGFHEAVTRFVPIYHERGDYAKLFGTILLCCGFVALSGSAVIAGFFLWPSKVLALVHQQGPSLKVVFVLIFMVPLEALDTLLMGLFASLASARSIFARRHLVSPLSRFAVVLLLIALHAGVIFLAFGYLLTTLAGIAVYSWILVRQLHRQSFFSQVRWRAIHVPAREIFSFTIPMVSADLLSILIQSVAVFLLGYYQGMRDVAFYRVVLPAAAMNQTVAITSALLYLPAAARLFAAGDDAGLRELYWRTATWVAVLSLPIFAATFAFARPLTIMLYGHRYADAGLLMAILAGGYYFDVVFGFNGLTLKALNKVGHLVACNLAAAAAGVGFELILIPRYGALGAAIGTTATLIVSTVLRQAMLGFTLRIRFTERKYLAFYAPIAASVLLLGAIRHVLHWNLALGALITLGMLLGVVLLERKELNPSETFPEAARIPVLGRLLALGARGTSGAAGSEA